MTTDLINIIQYFQDLLNAILVSDLLLLCIVAALVAVCILLFYILQRLTLMCRTWKMIN